MNSKLPFNPIRSLRFRHHRLLGALALTLSGTIRRGRVDAIGAPIINVFPGSSIFIGSDVCLISQSFATALAVNHPVVIRTLRSGARIEIGDRVGISGGSICAARLVIIGADSMIGANVTIADTDFHSPGPLRTVGHEDPAIAAADVNIGKRVFIGTNAIVLKGVTVGDNAVIGAGAVVSKSVPPNTIVAGNPSHIVRELAVNSLSKYAGD